MSKEDEIKGFLLEGKTVKELKIMGYKQSTIYKIKKSLEEPKIPEDKEKNPPQELPPILPPKVEEKQEEIQDDIFQGNSIINENISEEKEKSTGDVEEIPFREYDNINIIRDNSTIISIPEKTTAEKNQTKILPTEDLLAAIFSAIAAITGHEHWELEAKDKKIIKNLCKIPKLEQTLAKFGLYGCAMGLITIFLTRIQKEIVINKNKKKNKKELEKIEEEKPTYEKNNLLDSLNEI